MWKAFKIGFGTVLGIYAATSAVAVFNTMLEMNLKDSQENTEEQTETSE